MQVKFEDLKVGDKFLYKGKQHIKLKAFYKNCCSMKHNAIDLDGNNKVIKGYKLVEKLNEE